VGVFVQRCPVCEGRGIVPHGFYSYPLGQQFSSTNTALEQGAGNPPGPGAP
jgi:hypothetical protein